MLKDDGVDPQGGVQYSRYDRVRVESVFKETLKKERELREKAPRSGAFQMNLVNANMKGNLLHLNHSHNPNQIIAEKVEKSTPLERNSAKPNDKEDFGNKMIRHAEKYPWQKIDLPQSCSQEIGWILSRSMQVKTLRAQQAQSTRANPVGGARVEAYRSASLADLSGGKVGGDTSPTQASAKPGKSRSATHLPKLIPHLPEDEPNRPEVHQLNVRTKHNYHPKNFCPITKYADVYVSLMKHNPFDQTAAGR